MLQAPITGFGTSSTGQSIDLVDASQMTELAAALTSDQMNDYVAEHP